MNINRLLIGIMIGIMIGILIVVGLLVYLNDKHNCNQKELALSTLSTLRMETEAIISRVSQIDDTFKQLENMRSESNSEEIDKYIAYLDSKYVEMENTVKEHNKSKHKLILEYNNAPKQRVFFKKKVPAMLREEDW